MVREDTLKTLALPLAASQKVFQGGIACADTSTNTVKKGASGNSNLKKIGEFAENADNSSGTGSLNVLVNLDHEIVVRWYDNATGGNAITISNFFADVYVLDDHTVTTSSGSNSKAGRVWAVDTIKGVAVQATDLL
jgi:hypothetical protein